MVLGDVGCPQPEHNFNGSSLLQRISIPQKVKKCIKHRQFSIGIFVNKALHGTAWHNLIADGMTIGDLLSETSFFII